MAYSSFLRLASDMGFAPSRLTGIFSHWQMWIATRVFCMRSLPCSIVRPPRRVEMPQVLNPRILPLRSSVRRRPLWIAAPVRWQAVLGLSKEGSRHESPLVIAGFALIVALIFLLRILPPLIAKAESRSGSLDVG